MVLAFLALHFTLVWLHVNPLQDNKNRSFWGQWYCNPFFSQGWSMFVPVPENNYMLFVDYEIGGIKHQKELYRSLVMKHRANRLAGYEPLVVAFTNSIHFFEYATVLKEPLNGPIRGDLYFNMLRHSAINYLKHECSCDPDTSRLTLLIIPPAPAAPRAYYQ